jgi:hypothetical protein
MRIQESCEALQQSLRETGQALDSLDPWPAWRTFKAFLRRELEGGYDAAALQFLPTDPDPDLSDEASLVLVRQCTARASGGEDELVGRVVLEFRYAAQHFQHLPEVSVWTLDFPSLEEWASVVEGQPAFQEAMAREPLFSEVYYEEGAGEEE